MGENGSAPAADPIDAAIAAADQATTVAMQQFTVTISSTGRPAVVALPADVSDGEIAEFAGWLLTDLMRSKRAEREKPTSGLVIARGLPRPT